ncbi:tyrosine-type recombinase/integrase [Gloeobacter kilaueensis]|uniref:Integrase family protein n=1 Tax=Gloeobacter kilaueensis (strain ATCC BAA-2537 / CCAP 1431/1 / ULC 316 / JS1) TaxID=1183438 RepID=U5QQH2_GLOK1|nr:site-specific integrase [Gloeobacter kilaueensis]AGY59859.1 integrase family protein [Gloeobacter kilaueensis JS1]
MKINRHGQAKVFTEKEIQLLLKKGLTDSRYQAIFLTMLYTGCRVSEACSLRTADVYALGDDGQVRTSGKKSRVRYAVQEVITFRRASTKGGISTRSIPVHPVLRASLESFAPGGVYVFESSMPGTAMLRRTVDYAFRSAFRTCRIQGASTHSLRRTAITRLHAMGVGLRTIQRISGHRSLAALQRYIEVSDEQVTAAIQLL